MYNLFIRPFFQHLFPILGGADLSWHADNHAMFVNHADSMDNGHGDIVACIFLIYTSYAMMMVFSVSENSVKNKLYPFFIFNVGRCCFLVHAKDHSVFSITANVVP